jgi:hypothetical protein
MEGKKAIGIALVVVGIIIVVLTLIADQIEIGRSAGFGLHPRLGTFVGAVVTVVGVVLASKK